MSRFDRVLDVLDEGLELAAAPSYTDPGYGPSGADSPEWCWRCDASRATTEVGLCVACQEQMRDEKTTAPEPDVVAATLGVFRELDPDQCERLSAAYSEARARHSRMLLLEGIRTENEVRADFGLPAFMPPLQFPSGPAADADLAERLDHAADCRDCEEVLAEQMAVLVDLGDGWRGPLLGPDGLAVHGPRLVQGLILPGEPEPPIWLVFASGREVMLDFSNHWSSWVSPVNPANGLYDADWIVDAVIVEDES